MDFFKNIPSAPMDPIFGMNHDFAKDQRSFKVNLGVGSYKNEELRPQVLSSVKEAEKELIAKELYKEYLPIEGHPLFIQKSKLLVFGKDLQNVFCAQTIGGTGAIHVGGQFLYNFVSQNVFIPNPTWDNHRRIFTQLGFNVETYSYYDSSRKCFDFDGMSNAIQKMPQGSVIVLHACCHNPTGFDPSEQQWEELDQLIAKQGIIPFFDLAYLGFGLGIEEDLFSIKTFFKNQRQFLIASSFSKNFGLYCERVGNLFVVCDHPSIAQHVGSQIKVLIRGRYSNPPSHGAQIVAHILDNDHLRLKWKEDLGQMRARIKNMRHEFVKRLEQESLENFAFILNQQGMFSYTGLNESQVNLLNKEYAIYLTKDGRINVAGLNFANVDYVVNAIKNIMVAA